MVILVQAAQVSFAYGGNDVLRSTSFEVKSGDRLALVGPNGAGKSTLFKLMARIETPQAGSVTWQRGIRVGYMHQNVALPAGVSVLELLEQTSPGEEALAARLADLEQRMTEPLPDAEMAEVIDEYQAVLELLDSREATENREDLLLEVITGLGLTEDKWNLATDRLSGGEKKLVALAQFLLAQPDLLLLDEPDNHLDVNAKRWLEGYLNTFPGAIGIITHDRYLIDQVASKMFELEESKVHEYPGNYTRFLNQKAEREQKEREARDRQLKEVQRIKESSEQLTQWARQNPKFAPRAENMRRRLAEERATLDAMPNPRARRIMQVDFQNQRGGTNVLEITGLHKQYGERTIFSPFNLIIRQGERVGLIGPNGAGKTTLFRMILGEEQPDSGTLRLGAGIKPGYYSQEHETLPPHMTPLEFVRKRKALTEAQARSALAEYQFDTIDVTNRSDALSGGERSRLQILGLMLDGANFLLLDEPTNNLDIASTEALEAALLDQAGTMLAISHDRYFLEHVCTRVVSIQDGIVRDYVGGYTQYEKSPDTGTVLTRMA